MEGKEDFGRNGDLASALLTSNAYKSLSIEAEVFEVVSKYYPRAFQSPYFTDIDTGKLREIDVVAWARYCDNRKIKSHCNLYFFIECKSNKGFNIIASGEDLSNKPYVFDCQIWAGQDVNNGFEKSRRVLSRILPAQDHMNKDLLELDKIFYPRGRRGTINAEPEIFSNLPFYPSFRETNIKDEKDIDNSVLWRAFQSLLSAQESKRKKNWEDFENAILEYEVNNRLYKTKLSFEDVIGFSARNIDKIQKIIVIDSPLWRRTQANTIESIEYFRLLRQKIDDSGVDFVDVINRQYFSKYMEEVSLHYQKNQKEKRRRRIF